MIGDMKNRARAALVLLACLFALTSCVKVDGDLKVNSNETVSGSMKIGVDKQLMESSGTSLDKARQQVESGIKDTTTDGVSCKAFEDEKYVGSDCKFDQVPFSKMGSSTGDGVGFRKEGDKVVVTVKALNLGNSLPAGTPPSVNFKITMPGKITAHDDGASVSGRTATYDSLDKLGNVSLTSEASSGFPLWAIILIVVLLLAAAGAVVFFVLRGRKARGQQQYPPGQWGPQYAGQPGQQGMQYGQPVQYAQPGQPMQYGQPAPGQYPGQPPQGPQGPQQGQPGQWGQPGPQQRPPQGPPQGPPPQQGGWGQSPQQGWNQPPGQGGQQGGWGQPPQGNGGQGPEPS
jgi:hypothetical protein